MSELAMSGDDSKPSAAADESDVCGSAFAPIENILSIENVAETFGISRWLLRYCEFRGLIKRRNQIGSTWTYSWADCDRIAFIIKCRRAGLWFSEIAPLVRAVDDDSARVQESAQELCSVLVQRLEARRKALDEALSELAHTHSLLGAKAAQR